MTEAPLAGKVAAVIGHGDDTHRAIAVALAEAGTDVALATTQKTQAEEYGVNSIANEIWAIGREHFVQLMDEQDAGAVRTFATDAAARLGPCHFVVTAESAAPSVALGAFALGMEQAGGGTLVVVTSDGPRLADTAGAAWGVSIQVVEETSPAEAAASVMELLS